MLTTTAARCLERFVGIQSLEILFFHNLFYSIAARGVIVLFPTLGLSWAFCVIALYSDAMVWQYLFTLFASMQVTHNNYIHVC